jgi:hypothetical protein
MAMEGGNVVGLVVSVVFIAVCVGGLVATALRWRSRPRP